MKNNGVKLLAAVAVFAMVFAAVVVAIPSDAADKSYLSGNKSLGDSDITVLYPEGLTADVSGNKISFSGSATAAVANTNTTNGNGNDTFSGDFGAFMVSKGYAFFVIDGISKIIGEGTKIKVTQTNDALLNYTGDHSDNRIDKNVKTGNPIESTAYTNGLSFLIPKNGTSVEVKIDILGENDAVTDSKTYTFDFTKVSTRVVLTGTMADGNWSFADKTLTLAGYSGQEIFASADDLTVSFSKTNKITNYSNEKQAISAYSNSKGDLTVKASENDSKLAIDLKNPVNGALFSYDDMVIGNVAQTVDGESTPICTVIEITGNGNRAIYAVDALTINDANISAIGSERVIRVGDGNNSASVTVSGSSNIIAQISNSGSVNGMGDDDIFGIKADGAVTIGAGSKVITDGLHANGVSVAATTGEGEGKVTGGILVVSGDYTQNPNADIPSKIAGLYIDNLTTPVSVKNTTSTTVADAGIYLYNADYYGNIQVMTDGSEDPVEKIEVVADSGKLAEALEADEVSSVIFTGSSVSENVTLNKDVTFTNAVTIAGGKAIVVSSNASITIANSLTGDVKNGNNTMKFQNVTGKYTVVYGSIGVNGIVTGGTITLSMDDNKIQGTIDAATDSSVTITASGNGMKKISLSGDLTINAGKELTISDKVALIVPEGKTLTVNGTLTIDGALVVYGNVKTDSASDIAIAGTGKIALADSADVSAKLTYNANRLDNILKYEGATAIENTITGNTEWNTATYLTNDLTIAEDVTVTVGTRGYLDLCGNKLIVKGTLIVNGYVCSTNSAGKTGAIALADTGDIQNNGTIGKDSAVAISMYNGASAYVGVGSVTMENVKGVEISVDESYVGTTKTCTLVVSGDVSKTATKYTFAVLNAYIDGLYINDLVDAEAKSAANNNPATPATPVTITNSKVMNNGKLDIGSRATVGINGLTLGAGSVFTVDGKIGKIAGTSTTAAVHMVNGAVANINGNANTVEFDAYTGSYNTYNGDKRNDAEDALKNTSSKIVLNNLTSVVIQVTSKAYTEDVNGVETPKTEQMLEVAGDASFTKKDNGTSEESGSITFTGKVYVAAETELNLVAGMTFGASGTLVTNGSVTSITNTFSDYIGTYYTVKVPNTTGSGTTIVNHYTTFDAAFGVIDTAEQKTVTIKGGYTFSKDITITADQNVIFDNAKIASGVTVTVEKNAFLSNGFVVSNTTSNPKVAAGIQGILIVKDGGSCTPVANSYEVRSTSEDNTITYSGAAIAIQNGQPGSTIDIVSAVVFKDKITVPEGVTVKVGTTGSIAAEKGMAVNGTVVNNGTVAVTGDLEVAGTFDNNQSVSVSGTDAAMTVTGTYTGTVTASKINSAKYFANGEDVYTSVESALKAVAAMSVPTNVTVTGKVTENVDVTLVDGMTLTIKNGAEVVIKSVRLVAGSTLAMEADGALTTDVIGAVGKADTTGAVSDAIVDIAKVKGATFKLSYNESNTTYTMTMTLPSTYKGDVKVEQGSVSLAAENNDLTFADGTTLAVASGATLVINKDGIKFTDATGDKKYFSNEGTLSVKNSMVFEKAIIGGDIVVDAGKNLTIDASTVAGTVTLSEKDGNVATALVKGEVRIGSTPETLGATGSLTGKVTIDADAYVIAFSGSTFTTTVDGYKPTKFIINGADFATGYGYGKVGNIDAIVVGLDDLNAVTKDEAGNITGYNYSWKAADGTEIKPVPETVTATSFGTYDVLSTDIKYSAVNVTVSAGPGMTVYIDNLKVVNNSATLAIGEHTVVVYLEPNYQGTPAVTFNGATVSNGKIVITTDMLEGDSPMLVVTGATYVAPGTGSGSSGSSSDEGMSITDYLLIVLVVLIVIMAVLVAIRMMRS